MTRIDTLESQKVYNELKSFEETINWDGNNYIGNENPVFFAITPAVTTRSFYVKIATWAKDFKDKTEIRISDHLPSFKSNEKDLYFTFDDFDINVIKEIYNSKLN